jgi:poly(3-hydroxybutyrate) depolymerase
VRTRALELLLAACVATVPLACRTTASDAALTSARPSSLSQTANGEQDPGRLDAAAHSTSSASATAQEVPVAKLTPLSAQSAFVKLPVTGFRDAIVFVPVGATTPRPVLIALHGNFDRPEWQCETWREIAADYPFILCPRGIPRRDVPAKWDRWEYSSMDQTDRELQAALQALRDEFGQYIAPGPVLFTGFSLGAILGVGILKRHPGQFGPVVFSEGGNENWSAATVRKIAPVDGDAGSGGPLRILYACGQADCVGRSKGTAKIIERAGGQARVVSGGNVGHMYDGPVAAAIKREWTWLIEGDPRWVPQR